MRAGSLNRQVSIRYPSTWTRSTDGGVVPVWTTVLDTVWADRQPVSGRELFTQDARWAEVTTKFILRYSSLVNPKCRVIDLGDSSAEYEIDAVIDIRDERRGLELLAHKTE